MDKKEDSNWKMKVSDSIKRLRLTNSEFELFKNKNLLNQIEIAQHEKWVAYYHRTHNKGKKFTMPIIIDDDVVKISLEKNHPEWVLSIILHEGAEIGFRNKGQTYEQAHQKATEMELKFAEKYSINWGEYSKMIDYVYDKEGSFRRSSKIFLD